MCNKILSFIANIYPPIVKKYKYFLTIFYITIIIVIFSDLNVLLKGKLVSLLVLILVPISAQKWNIKEKNHNSFFYKTICFNHIMIIFFLSIIILK